MTTLTANTTRLPEHCEHKLPTSCRLTARPICCACQDNRPHASSYSKYIDGVGFVPWGTRQERYCWPCKEFWDARIQISGMRPADTRVPESPDVTDFLRQWYDWQRGYRLVQNENGTEQRQTLLGEPLSQCAHGYLPRTLDELRNQVMPGARERMEGLVANMVMPTAASSRPPVVDELVIPEDERLFDDEDDEEPDENSPVPNMPTAPLDPSAVGHGHLVARTINNLGALVGGPALESSAPTRPSGEAASTQPIRIARQHYQRVTALRHELQRTRLSIERVMSGLQELDVDVPDSTEVLGQLNQLNANLRRYQEEPLDIPEINDPDYQSPIGGMFERAHRWHQQVQADRMHAFIAQRPPGFPDPPMRTPFWSGLPAPGSQPGIGFPPPYPPYRRPGSPPAPPGEPEQPRSMGLDEPGRPPAIEDEEAFKIEARCEVCLQQVANVATFPCSHMIMCQWCADEAIPRHHSARNVPRNVGAKCPQCRKKIKHIYTVRVRLAKDYSEPGREESQGGDTAAAAE